MERTCINKAKYIFVLNDGKEHSDARVMASLSLMSAMGCPAYKVAECHKESNKGFMCHNGADAVLRPVRSYPELLVRAAAEPGTEKVFEALFDTKGESVHRVKNQMDYPATWSTLTEYYNKNKILGIPIGYVCPETMETVLVPKADETVSCETDLFLLKKGVI